MLGDCLVKLGHYEEAEPLLTESYDEMKTQRDIYDRYVLEALQRVIELYDSWDKPDKAAEYRAMRAKPVSAG